MHVRLILLLDKAAAGFAAYTHVRAYTVTTGMQHRRMPVHTTFPPIAI